MSDIADAHRRLADLADALDDLGVGVDDGRVEYAGDAVGEGEVAEVSLEVTLPDAPMVPESAVDYEQRLEELQEERDELEERADELQAENESLHEQRSGLRQDVERLETEQPAEEVASLLEERRKLQTRLETVGDYLRRAVEQRNEAIAEVQDLNQQLAGGGGSQTSADESDQGGSHVVRAGVGERSEPDPSEDGQDGQADSVEDLLADPPDEVPEDDPEPDTEGDQEELPVDVWDELTPGQQTILETLVETGGGTAPEIAEAADLAEGTVRPYLAQFKSDGIAESTDPGDDQLMEYRPLVSLPDGEEDGGEQGAEGTPEDTSEDETVYVAGSWQGGSPTYHVTETCPSLTREDVDKVLEKSRSQLPNSEPCGRCAGGDSDAVNEDREAIVLDVLEEEGPLHSTALAGLLAEEFGTSVSTARKVAEKMAREAAIDSWDDPESPNRTFYGVSGEAPEEPADVERCWPADCGRCGETIHDGLERDVHQTEVHGKTLSTYGLEPGEFESLVEDADDVSGLVDALPWGSEKVLRLLGVYGLQGVVGGDVELSDVTDFEFGGADDDPDEGTGEPAPAPDAETPTAARIAMDHGLDREAIADAIADAQAPVHVHRELGIPRGTAGELCRALGVYDEEAGVVRASPSDAGDVVREHVPPPTEVAADGGDDR